MLAPVPSMLLARHGQASFGESFIAFNRAAVNTGLTKLIHGRRGSTLVSFNEHGHLERGECSLVTYG